MDVLSSIQGRHEPMKVHGKMFKRALLLSEDLFLEFERQKEPWNALSEAIEAEKIDLLIYSNILLGTSTKSTELRRVETKFLASFQRLKALVLEPDVTNSPGTSKNILLDEDIVWNTPDSLRYFAIHGLFTSSRQERIRLSLPFTDINLSAWDQYSSQFDRLERPPSAGFRRYFEYISASN
jgi:hypothetical protein